MRACLEGIRHLDPVGVARRIAEFDDEIGRLESLLPGRAVRPAMRSPIEIVSIGTVPGRERLVKAA